MTPWDDPDWRTEALDWLSLELGRAGIEESGPRRIRLRPWSIVLRLEAERPVWFKAASPGSAFEAGLSEALTEYDCVLTPYAVDATRGWLLLPDGGPRLRDVPSGPDDWADILGRYAEFQRSLVPSTATLLGLGVPDARPSAMPAYFDRLVGGSQCLSPDDRSRLRTFQSTLADWCAELDAIGIPATLDHADLHDGQILVPEPGRYTFFDWGDANVSHPFCSLLVAVDHIAEQYGADVVPRMQDAYLEPWTGYSRRDLLRAAELARRLSHLTRASSWTRLFPTAARLGDPERAAALIRLISA